MRTLIRPLITTGPDRQSIQAIVDDAPEQLKHQIWEELSGSTRSREALREQFRKKHRRPRRQREETLRELRKWYEGYKAGLVCSRCDETDSACISFHHKDTSLKEANISSLLQCATSKSEILAEMAKCIVLCANCHLKLHRDIKKDAATRVAVTRGFGGSNGEVR